MDPRIRQRRVEVRRNEGRRRLRFLVAVVALVVLSAAGWVASRSPLLDIDAVEVEGSTRTPPAVVRQAARLHPGKPMFDVREEAAARRVEALPWVAEARVFRRWPGTVSISVAERAPFAAALDPTGAWWLVDRSGRVLEASSSRPPGLVAVEGLGATPTPGQPAPDAEAALAVSAALSAPLAAKVDAVVVVQGGGVDLRLKEHGVVRLGDLEDLGRKLRAAESVLASVDVRDLAVLDVRLPASPVLTRQE